MNILTTKKIITDDASKSVLSLIKPVNNLPGSRCPYALLPAEPFLEYQIIIPKTNLNQEILHRILREGRNLEEIKNHFNDKNTKSAIDDFFRKHDILKSCDYTIIDKFPDLYNGYSISEADGAFFDGNGRIYEERTLFVKLIFKPNWKELSKEYQEGGDVKKIAKEVFNNIDNIDSKQAGDDIRERIINDIRERVFYVRLFVFGYVGFNLCNLIIDMLKSGEIERDQIEEEIWVISFPGNDLHRIVYDPLKEG